MLAFMFPGQGSQFSGMGEEFFRESRMFRALEPQIDRIAGFAIRETCLHGDEEMLRKTEVTQPCLYIVNALHHEKLSAEVGPPDFLAGHSLGEINALQAAGAFDLLNGLRMVVERGRLMGREHGGAMAAVIGLGAGAVAQALKNADQDTIDIANLNTPQQVVISGPGDAVAKMEGAMLDAGARAFVPLSVGAAFHSRYMVSAAQDFERFLHGMPFRPLRKPVISNVTARPYPSIGPDTEIASLLARQLRTTVLWQDTVNFLRDERVTRFVEIGPGQVLSRMLCDFD